MQIRAAKGQMPLRGSCSHWWVRVHLSGSTYLTRSGSVCRGVFGNLLNSRNIRTSGQPPPVGGKSFSSHLDRLYNLCMAATVARGNRSAVNNTATTRTTAAPSAQPPSQREETVFLRGEKEEMPVGSRTLTRPKMEASSSL